MNLPMSQGQPKKHVGIIKSSGSKVAVLFFKNMLATNNKVLVIRTESLREAQASEILSAIDSTEGQSAGELGQYLHLKGVLGHYKESGYIEPVDPQDILMMPYPNVKIPLLELMENMRKFDATIVMPTGYDSRSETAKDNHISNANPLHDKMVEQIDQTGDKAKIAKNLLYQASLLEADANKKREEAYSLVPTLRAKSAPAPQAHVINSNDGYLPTAVIDESSFTIPEKKPTPTQKKSRGVVRQEIKDKKTATRTKVAKAK